MACSGLLFTTVLAQTKQKKKGRSQKTNPLTNNVDSMSYAFGINLGEDIGRNLEMIPGGKINIDLLLKGFDTSMKKGTTLMTPEMAQSYFRDYMVAMQKAEAEFKKSEGLKFLEENGKRNEVVTTSSGLQYEIVVPAEGPKPMANSQVTVHYEGTLIDGTKFDSSYDRKSPITFGLNQVIAGWTEGVQLMSVGATYKFYIPYHLGYGEGGKGSTIPPFSTLVFTVELLEIK